MRERERDSGRCERVEDCSSVNLKERKIQITGGGGGGVENNNTAKRKQKNGRNNIGIRMWNEGVGWGGVGG